MWNELGKDLQTGGPGDEGSDIIARRGRELAVIQCKRYRTAVLGPHAVRELREMTTCGILGKMLILIARDRTAKLTVRSHIAVVEDLCSS